MTTTGWDNKRVAELLGIDNRLIRYWSDEDAVKPGVQDVTGRRGTRRKYDYKNLVQIGILNSLRKLGVNLTESKAILDTLEWMGYFRYYPKPCHIAYNGPDLWAVFVDRPSQEHNRRLTKAKTKLGGRPPEEVIRQLGDMASQFEDHGPGVVVPVHKIEEDVRRKVGRMR
jgi:DNA-binding transcriptional MerR regulator